MQLPVKILRKIMRSRRTSDGKPTILVSSARSGTNYFLDVYSACFPGDVVLGEIFRSEGDNLNRLRRLLGLTEEQVLAGVRDDPLAIWKALEAICRARRRGLVAKAFYYHARNRCSLWEHFRDQNRVVHLIRRNAFDVLVSLELARQTGRWKEYRGRPTDTNLGKRIYIPRVEMEEHCEKHRQNVVSARKYFAGSDYSEIMYEDIAESTADCVSTLSAIYPESNIGGNVRIQLKKQKKRRNSEIVENYDEISDLDCAII